MLAVRISNSLENRLNKLAKLTGRPKSFYVRQALSAHWMMSRTPTLHSTAWKIQRGAGHWMNWNADLTSKAEHAPFRF